MNRSMIRYLLSKLLLIEAGLLIVPLVVAAIYREPAKIFVSIEQPWPSYLRLASLVVFTNQRIFTSMLRKES